MDYLAVLASTYLGYVVGRDFVIKSAIFLGVFIISYAGVLWMTRDEEED